MAAKIEHPDLGEVCGNSVDGVTQFLGIRYASLEGQLAPAELVESHPSGALDATKLG